MIEGPIVVELVDAQVVRPLRRAVLRPEQPPEMSRYPGDDDLRSAHAAVVVGGSEVAAVGTVLAEAPPWAPHRADAWRVRGMATRPDVRGRGWGQLVLDALVDHVVAHEGGLVWCNARVPATNLYERAGFVARGEVFDIPGIGPHLQMWRALEAESA